MNKHEYWWISVAGKPCEPAIFKDGAWFTLGCGDPMAPSTFRQVAQIEDDEIPYTPAQERNARRRQLYALNNRPHGYMPK